MSNHTALDYAKEKNHVKSIKTLKKYNSARIRKEPSSEDQEDTLILPDVNPHGHVPFRRPTKHSIFFSSGTHNKGNLLDHGAQNVIDENVRQEEDRRADAEKEDQNRSQVHSYSYIASTCL